MIKTPPSDLVSEIKEHWICTSDVLHGRVKGDWNIFNMAANEEEDDDGNDTLKTLNILLGVTGSVASIKIPLLVEKLLQLQGVRYDFTHKS